MENWSLAQVINELKLSTIISIDVIKVGQESLYNILTVGTNNPFIVNDTKNSASSLSSRRYLWKKAVFSSPSRFHNLLHFFAQIWESFKTCWFGSTFKAVHQVLKFSGIWFSLSSLSMSFICFLLVKAPLWVLLHDLIVLIIVLAFLWRNILGDRFVHYFSTRT